MPITFAPRPATVLLCDYTAGFVPPEMVKRRPVVVLSPRQHHIAGTVLVVPFSTAPPRIVEPFHVRIPAGTYAFFRRTVIWAKADMIAAVSQARLSPLVRMDPRGNPPRISPEDFRAVQRAVLHALGFARLTSAV